MQNAIRELKLLIVLGLAAVFVQYPAMAQQSTLSLSSGSSVPGGSATLSLSLAISGGEQPASVQWTMTYPPSDISGVTVAAGAGDSGASKTVSCSSSSGSTICVTYGMNANVIGAGVLATATFTISAGALDPSAAIQLTGVVVSSPAGISVPGIRHRRSDFDQSACEYLGNDQPDGGRERSDGDVERSGQRHYYRECFGKLYLQQRG